jgi:hypothetical protein
MSKAEIDRAGIHRDVDLARALRHVQPDFAAAPVELAAPERDAMGESSKLG